MGSLVNRVQCIQFSSFVIKAALTVEPRIEHAAAAQDGNQDCEGLEGRKVLHVFGQHTAEQDTGGANERSHLGDKREGI